MSENEEIIVDDVDVSGCDHLYKSRKKKTLCCDCYGGYCHGSEFCTNNPDCFHKQLQREKQKNKELTEDFNEICKRHNEAFEEFNKLKQTNEKLRKTLKEIEEIAEYRSLYCENCNKETITCENCGYIKILSKIKETKNEQKN